MHYCNSLSTFRWSDLNNNNVLHNVATKTLGDLPISAQRLHLKKSFFPEYGFFVQF